MYFRMFVHSAEDLIGLRVKESDEVFRRRVGVPPPPGSAPREGRCMGVVTEPSPAVMVLLTDGRGELWFWGATTFLPPEAEDFLGEEVEA